MDQNDEHVERYIVRVKDARGFVRHEFELQARPTPLTFRCFFVNGVSTRRQPGDTDDRE